LGRRSPARRKPIPQQAGPEAGAPTDALQEFSEIRYPPVASVVLGFRREDVAHPCEGFGMLIPKIEGFKILGTIFSSSLFPNRAPAGHLTLTSYIGGQRYPEFALLPPEKLVALTCEDLRVLLGVSRQAGLPALRALSEGHPAIQRRLRPLPRIDERNRKPGGGLFLCRSLSRRRFAGRFDPIGLQYRGTRGKLPDCQMNKAVLLVNLGFAGLNLGGRRAALSE
jgi:hypothetical protein